MKCLACRDMGMPGKGCPSCGKIKGSVKPVVEVTEGLIKNLCIPDQYVGVTWNEEKLREDYPQFSSNKSFEHYVRALAKIYDRFTHGVIPYQSAFIIAPRRMSKLTWAYACIQQGLKHGFTVAPILDNTQYHRISVLSSQKPDSAYLRKFNYSIEDIENADVLFLTVDKANYHGSIRVFDSIIDKRTRIGKPVFILSRMPLIELTKGDYYSATGLVDRERRNNILKYPAFIECKVRVD